MSAQLPEWMAGEYTIVRAERTTAMVRNDFVDSFHRHRLMGCSRSPPLTLPEAEGSSGGDLPGGRGGVRITQAGPLGEAVVRPYRRGGLVETFNRRRYFLGDRAFSEFVSTHRLRRRGAPVPEVLAAVQSSLRPGYEACLVTRRLPGVLPAGVVLHEASDAAHIRVLDSMGRAIRLLHEAGGIHADLNAHNVLVSEDGTGPAFVIDLDRVIVLEGPVPGRRARKNLQRLRRSFLKLGLDEALADWDRLERGYSVPPEPLPAA